MFYVGPVESYRKKINTGTMGNNYYTPLANHFGEKRSEGRMPFGSSTF